MSGGAFWMWRWGLTDLLHIFRSTTAAPLHAQIITMPVVRAALMHVSPLAGATLMHRYLLPHLHAKYGKHFVKQLRSTGKFLPEASGRRQRRGAARRKPCISSLVAIREAEE